jgi:hypothetical protein
MANTMEIKQMIWNRPNGERRPAVLVEVQLGNFSPEAYELQLASLGSVSTETKQVRILGERA